MRTWTAPRPRSDDIARTDIDRRGRTGLAAGSHGADADAAAVAHRRGLAGVRALARCLRPSRPHPPARRPHQRHATHAADRAAQRLTGARATVAGPRSAARGP